MAIRINRAKNFAGKNYIVTTEIQQLLSGLALNNNLVLSLGSGYSFDDDTSITAPSIDLTPVKTAAVSAVTGNALVKDNVVLGSTSNSVKASTKTLGGATLTITGEGSAATASADVLATEAGVKAYVDNHAIAVSAGNGVTIDKSNALNPVISTNLKITKVDTTAGFAASYKLQYLSDATAGTYADVSGDTIDIVKDQFIKSATFGWSSSSTSEVDDFNTDKAQISGTAYPCIKIEIYTNDNGSSADDTIVSTIYIPLANVFSEYTAGNGIDASALTSNAITVVADTSDKIYTAKGTQASVMSVGANGIKATGIQAAIDLAVNDEHAKASAAVAGLNSRIDDLKTKAETAIDALDSAVDAEIASVESNVGTALTGTVSSVNAKVNSAVGNVNTNVGTAVTALNGKVDAAVTAVNGAIGGSVSAVNGAVSAAVSDVNGKVSAAVTKAVELEETTYTFGTAPATVTSGVATITGVTGNVLAVFDTTGAQVYPDIVKTGAGTEATNTLSADYGTENTTGLKWVVLHTKAIAYTNAAYSNATASSATAPAAVSYTNAGSATNAVATAVATTDTTGTVDIAAIASAVTIGALDYTTK